MLNLPSLIFKIKKIMATTISAIILCCPFSMADGNDLFTLRCNLRGDVETVRTNDLEQFFLLQLMKVK